VSLLVYLPPGVEFLFLSPSRDVLRGIFALSLQLELAFLMWMLWGYEGRAGYLGIPSNLACTFFSTISPWRDFIDWSSQRVCLRWEIFFAFVCLAIRFTEISYRFDPWPIMLPILDPPMSLLLTLPNASDRQAFNAPHPLFAISVFLTIII